MIGPHTVHSLREESRILSTAYIYRLLHLRTLHNIHLPSCTIIFVLFQCAYLVCIAHCLQQAAPSQTAPPTEAVDSRRAALRPNSASMTSCPYAHASAAHNRQEAVYIMLSHQTSNVRNMQVRLQPAVELLRQHHPCWMSTVCL